MKAMIATVLALIPGAHAQQLPLPGPAGASGIKSPQALSYEQRLGARLPLAAPFVDESGRAIALGAYFGQRPVALVLGYYRCPNLCTTLTEGVLETLRETGLAGGAYEVVAVSIDPDERSDIASRKKASYAPWLRDAAAHVHLLTGAPASIADLSHAAGLRYAVEPGDGGQQRSSFAHPAGFLIVTPQGQIAQYFLGVRFDAQAVRLALVNASAGAIGSLSDRLLLLCSHFDAVTGRYSLRVMAALRALVLVAAALLAGLIWHLARRRRLR